MSNIFQGKSHHPERSYFEHNTHFGTIVRGVQNYCYIVHMIFVMQHRKKKNSWGITTIFQEVTDFNKFVAFKLIFNLLLSRTDSEKLTIAVWKKLNLGQLYWSKQKIWQFLAVKICYLPILLYLRILLLSAIFSLKKNWIEAFAFNGFEVNTLIDRLSNRRVFDCYACLKHLTYLINLYFENEYFPDYL